jgi:predicted NodU family carbamoyl transferase
MPEQLILAVHHGPDDAAAVVLVDYDPKAAVQLEHLTRVKDPAVIRIWRLSSAVPIFQCSISNISAVGAGCVNRTQVEGKKPRSIARETRRANTAH